MRRVAQDRKRARNCAANCLGAAKDKANDRDKDQFAASPSCLDVRLLEVVSVLKGAPVFEGRVIVGQVTLPARLAAKQLLVAFTNLHFAFVCAIPRQNRL